MIWFGNLDKALVTPSSNGGGLAAEQTRMQLALEQVAEMNPGLTGRALLSAIVATGLIDLPSAQRLLPYFRKFDADRHFAEYVRRLSFRGRPASEEFRTGIRCITEEITGSGWIGEIGSEPCIRFVTGEHEGIVLAEPEVGFTISGRTREVLAAAVEEMPDSVIIVARSFQRNTEEQLRAVLDRTEVPGTLITVNLLLGIRATVLRYQPRAIRILDLLSAGGNLRSADIARLGDREMAA